MIERGHPVGVKALLIDLPTLPEEGKHFSGEIAPEVFGLQEDDARPLGPLEFDLFAQRFGSELLLTGRLSAPFEFTCVRTLHPFRQTIELPGAAVSLEIKEGGQIDVTEALREEVLLAFPPNPRCDDADEPMSCEIDPQYLAVDKSPGDGVETPPREGDPDRWSALDALKNLDPER